MIDNNIKQTQSLAYPAVIQSFKIKATVACEKIGDVFASAINLFRTKQGALENQKQRIFNKLKNCELGQEKRHDLEKNLNKIQDELAEVKYKNLPTEKKLALLNQRTHLVNKYVEKSGKFDLNANKDLDKLKELKNQIALEIEKKSTPQLKRKLLQLNENLKHAEFQVLQGSLQRKKAQLERLAVSGIDRAALAEIRSQIKEINKSLENIKFQLKPLIEQYAEKVHAEFELAKVRENEYKSKNPDQGFIAQIDKNLNIVRNEIRALENQWQSIYGLENMLPMIKKATKKSIAEHSSGPSPMINKNDVKDDVLNPKNPLNPNKIPRGEIYSDENSNDNDDAPLAPFSGKIPPPPLPGLKTPMLRFAGEPKAEPDEKLKKLNREDDRLLIQDQIREIQEFLSQYQAVLDPIRAELSAYAKIKQQHDDVIQTQNDSKRQLIERQKALETLQGKPENGHVILTWKLKNKDIKIPYYSDEAFDRVNQDLKSSGKEPLNEQFKISKAREALGKKIEEIENEIKLKQKTIDALNAQTQAYEAKTNNDIPFAKWEKELKAKESKIIHVWKRALDNKINFLAGKKVGLEHHEGVDAKDPGAVSQIAKDHPELDDYLSLPAMQVVAFKRGNKNALIDVVVSPKA